MEVFWLILVPALLIWSVVLTLRENTAPFSYPTPNPPVWKRPKLPVWVWLLIALGSVVPVINWTVICATGFFAILNSDDIIGEWKWWGGVPKWLTKKI